MSKNLKIPNFTSESALKTILESLDSCGAVVITDLISELRLLDLAQELEREFKKVDVCQGDFYGYATKRISGLVAKSVVARELATNTLLMSVLDQVLLKSCKQYQLNLTQGIKIGPGEPKQMLHRDDAMFPYEHTNTEAMVNCMWAVDDFTKQNGATNLVLGSHKWNRARSALPHEIQCAEMKKGSVLIYLGSLIHAGGANVTNKPRTGLVISYCNGWLRQAENQYLAVARNEVASFDEQLQKLLGYFVHKPNLGCLEGKDPIHMLRGDGSPSQFIEFIPQEAIAKVREHRKAALQEIAENV